MSSLIEELHGGRRPGGRSGRLRREIDALNERLAEAEERLASVMHGEDV
ncbi:hypothetical protein ACFWGI_19095 [Streptomyces niveus]